MRNYVSNMYNLYNLMYIKLLVRRRKEQSCHEHAFEIEICS